MSNLDQDIEFENTGGRITFDFQGFIFKIIRNWFFIALSIVIGLAVAHYINIRKQNVYRLNALVSVLGSSSFLTPPIKAIASYAREEISIVFVPNVSK